MIRGLYSGLTGMLAQSLQQDIIAENLANANTVGYQREQSSFASFPSMLMSELASGRLHRSFHIGGMGTGSQVYGTYLDTRVGALRETGDPLHIALREEGYYAIQVGDEIEYTRNGNFLLDADGNVTTEDGFAVLGQNGPIRVAAGQAVAWNERGELVADERVLDRLATFRFENVSGLHRVGDTRFRATEASGPALPAEIRQSPGFLEGSNVGPIQEMVGLIAAMRAYEANQRSLSIQDGTLGQAVNELLRG